MFDFRKTFAPTKEEIEEQQRFALKIRAENIYAKQCCVCAHGLRVKFQTHGGVWDTITKCALGIERYGSCDKWEEGQNDEGSAGGQ